MSGRDKAAGSVLCVRGLCVRLPGGRPLLEDVCLEVAAGEVVVVLGGSGAGKSTLTRVLLERDALERQGFVVRADAIEFDGADLGLVPQRGALFDHVDVRGNLTLAMRYARTEQAVSVADWLARVGLDPALAASGTRVGRLSGGQAQRVAVARVLAGGRRLLLLDEPSVGLDPHRVRELARLVRAQVDSLGLAAVVITHDVALAAGVADRVYVLGPQTRRLERLFAADWPGPVEAPGMAEEVRGRWLLALEGALVGILEPGVDAGGEERREGQGQEQEWQQREEQQQGQERQRQQRQERHREQQGQQRQGQGERRRALGGLAALVLRPFAMCAVALGHGPGQLVRRSGDFAVVGGRVLMQALARPLAFYAIVSVLIGYTVLLVLGKVGGAGVRPDALIRQIGGSHIVALAPALSAMLFVAASGSATNAWLGSMTLTRQTLAMEALGIPARAYLWSPAWLGLGLAYLATAALFALGMIAGGVAVCAQHGMADGWALLTGDVLDPRPERMPYAVRAGFLCWIYAWGIASDVVARGTAAKSDAHAGLLVVLLAHCRRPPLRVQVYIEPRGDARGQARGTPGGEPGVPGGAWAADALRVDVPAALAGRVRVRVDGRELGPWTGPDMLAGALGPGMHRIEWLTRYRGGFERRVGMTRVTGPFQDVAAPPCALRVIVGQDFVDDGAAGPGTLAHALAHQVRRELGDFDTWPLGRLRAVDAVRLGWVRLSDVEARAAGAGQAGSADGAAEVAARRARALARLAGSEAAGSVGSTGLLQVSLILLFEGGAAPVWLGVVPRVTDQGLALFAHADAAVALDNGFYQWIYELLDGDAEVSAIVQREVDGALGQGLGMLPPLALPGGASLRFAYCRARPVDVVTGRHAAVWLSLAAADVGASGDAGASGAAAPVLLGPAPPRDLHDLDAPLAVELELDALNGVLHALWRSGFLDRSLARAGAVQAFNRDPRVARLLSVRIADLRLAMAPSVWYGADRALHLGVEAALRIRDLRHEGQGTPARIFGAATLDVDGTSMDVPPAPSPGTASVPSLSSSLLSSGAVDLAELALTCEPEPGVLVPCYGDLVQAWAWRGDDVQGALSRRFTALLDELVLGRRIEVPGRGSARVGLTIERARVHATPASPTGVIRVELFGRRPGR